MTVMADVRIHAPIGVETYELLFTPREQARLAALGELTVAPVSSSEELAGRLDGVDIMVSAWGTPTIPVPAAVDGGVRLVAHAAGSVRKLAPRELIEHGVQLTQAAAAMAPAVAEMALTQALVLLRHVHQHDRVLQTQRDWRGAKAPGLGSALTSRIIGVVGASRAGVEYIKMVRGLGAADVRVYDPYLPESAAVELGVRRVELDELCAECEVVAVHAPTTPETHHMIGVRQLAALPDGAVITNTARSWVVDQDALLVELRTGRIRAGLDVFDVEPQPADSPFLGLPNVLVTPHEAGATVEARHRQGQITVDEVERFVAGAPLQHAVTVETYDRLA
jgi:phosphoglycerate dehydrogenase-like enzyme